MFQEIKSLAQHSFIYWIGVILARVVGFLLIPVYTRYLTPADYGTIELLFLTADIAGLVIGMQISQGVFKFYHQYETQSEKDRLISTALISMLALGVILAVGFNVFARPITILVFGSETYLKYFRFYSFVYPLNLIVEIPFTLIRIKKQSKLYVVYNLINFLMMISLSIFFIVYMGWGIWGVLISPAITFVVLAIFLLKRTFSKVGFSFSLRIAKQVLKFTIPLIPASLGMFILHFSNRYFVKHFCSLSEVGIYSLGFKFGFILSGMVIQPFTLIWQTYLYEIAKNVNAREIFGRVLTYFVLTLILFGLIVSVPIQEVIRIMAAPPFYQASSVVPLIASAYILSGINLIFQAGLFINGKTQWIGSITFLSAVVNLIANFFLVSSLGIMGAALSTFASFLFMAGGTFYVSHQIYPIDIEYLRISKIVGIALLVFAISRYVEFDSIIVSLVFKTFLILIFPFTLFISNFLNKSEKNRIHSIGKLVLGRLA
jgi:O-antigen/teichoic acid export membrane protein